MNVWRMVTILIAVLVEIHGAFASAPSSFRVIDYGAVPGGAADCTGAFQKALDEAAKAGSGIVDIPAGEFRFDGVLSIPGGVTLQGTFRAAPSPDHETRPRMDGTILMARAGRNEAKAAPFITLSGSNAVLAGVIVAYPEWRQSDVPPVPYPPTVYAGTVVNTAVLDCLLLNAYEGIHFEGAARFLVRNVHGYPSWRGLYVDACYDIGRVENCHFWPFGVNYTPEDPYCLWVNTHGTAFEFARTDWQYVTNTFCFGYGVGYKFAETKSGSCNGNFLGIGADCCTRAVLVEQAQAPGLLITNGEFVGRWASTRSVGVEIAPSATDGKVSLNNCSFWGPLDRCVWARSTQCQFTAIATHFLHFNIDNVGSPAIDLDAGKAIIEGDTFGEGETHVRVGEKVISAIITGNQANGGLTVENHAGQHTQLANNETSGVEWSKRAKSGYAIDIGVPGDQTYLSRWHGREKAVEWPNEPGHKRWTSGESLLRLPVLAQKTYMLAIDVYTPPEAAAADNGIFLGDKRLASLPSSAGTATITCSVPPSKTGETALALRVKSWKPRDLAPTSNDTRTLGVAVRRVTMTAKGTHTKAVTVNGEGR